MALTLAALSFTANAVEVGFTEGNLNGSGASNGSGDADFGGFPQTGHSFGTPNGPYLIDWDYTPTNGVVVVTARVVGTLFLDRLGSGCARLKINFQDSAFNSLFPTQVRQFCGPGFNANDAKNQLDVDVRSSPDKRLRYVQFVIGSGNTTGTIRDDKAVTESFRMDVSDRIDSGTADFGNPPHFNGSPSSDGSISLVLLDDGRIKGRVAGTLFWDSNSAGCARMLIDFLDINGATLGGNLGTRQIDKCGLGGNANDSSNQSPPFIKSTLDGAPFEQLFKIRLTVGTLGAGGDFVNEIIRTYSFGSLVGIVQGIPARAITPVGEDTTYGVQWTVPDPAAWRSLDIMDVRLIDGEDEVLRVRWDEAANTFSQFDPGTGRFSAPAQPGSHKKFRSSAVTMFLENSEVDGSGPTGPAVLLRLNLRFSNEAAGRTFTVQARARDDSGGVQGWDRAGAIQVFPSGGDDENDGDVDKRGEDGK